jgi:hypothetical protein
VAVVVRVAQLGDRLCGRPECAVEIRAVDESRFHTGPVLLGGETTVPIGVDPVQQRGPQLVETIDQRLATQRRGCLTKTNQNSGTEPERVVTLDVSIAVHIHLAERTVQLPVQHGRCHDAYPRRGISGAPVSSEISVYFSCRSATVDTSRVVPSIFTKSRDERLGSPPARPAGRGSRG